MATPQCWLDVAFTPRPHAREQKALANKHVIAMEKLGRRCIAVATTNADEDTDEPGGYKLAGVLSFGPGTSKVYQSQTRGGYARVEMRPAALRIQHWLNLVLMIIMTATGYYIMKPFSVPHSGKIRAT